MPLKIVRNDITRMEVDAIVNTANEAPRYSSGVDTAIYHAAGEQELLAERQKIGWMSEGEVAITPGFKLPAKYIIHAVSPRYKDGESGEEKLLRGCYRKSLQLAHKHGCESIAFPLISTGGFGYPKEEGMGIAVDEINKYLLRHDMMVYLVVFDTKSTELALRLQPALDAYIDHNYVCDKREEEYGDRYFGSVSSNAPGYNAYRETRLEVERQTVFHADKAASATPTFNIWKEQVAETKKSVDEFDEFEFYDVDENALTERIKHASDTFQEYLFYLIQSKGLKNPDVYNRALITKQTFSKIKKNREYHPDKATAMRLCVGARLSLDETIDLLARAGYALSPCDKRDIIFKFYIEHEAYDIYAIDISLEQHGLPCFIAS